MQSLEGQTLSLTATRSTELSDDDRFDAVIVDEAQDFADDWWTPLVGALRDELTGGIFAYSDERQRAFDWFGRPPLALVPLVPGHQPAQHPADRVQLRAVGADVDGAVRWGRSGDGVRPG